ncbi:class I SAM-dependent methyltransferase [Siminovitchia fortis]|uniref:Methyltransferase domain-containing protein n=1 Tax=Siminovitchia fortis TaxID=254758 RepID=A0A443ILY3_9BACI|nr:class I SAM-dependent methyltransferase [Siminovitchia fortis]RWR06265.1 methyltransferase domain-containing protein [Siminovitchia fortis]WHY81100.1 class I SAM-dependent methyltransferase [Siminovitchia fortis]
MADPGQFGKPAGPIGKFFGWMMDKYNKVEHEETIQILDLQPDDHVLEIGYGTGQAIRLAVDKIQNGKIVGVDHSDAMFEVASRKNKKWIHQGIVDLLVGDAGKLDFGEKSFDKVYSIHCIYFWEQPESNLKEIYRVLKNKGIIAITVRTGKGEVYEKFTDSNVKKWLENCGFKNVTIKRYGKVKRKSSIILGEK